MGGELTMKKLSNKRPSVIENNKIRWNIREINTAQEDNSIVIQYEYDELELIGMNITYPAIVSTIIRDKYSADDVEAILLNGDDTEEHSREYTELQEYREYAKNTAKEILNAHKIQMASKIENIKNKIQQIISSE